MAESPPITGPQLIWLFEQDGWVQDGQRTHGVAMTKPGRYPVIIPAKKRELADTTLGQILSVKQSGLGKKGLMRLIEKHGLHK